MYKWYLPTLSEIIQAGESEMIQSTRQQRASDQAEREWYGAIAALNTLLSQDPSRAETDSSCADAGHASIKGLILSGPFPVINRVDLGDDFSTWTLTGDPTLRPGALQLPAAEFMDRSRRKRSNPSKTKDSAESTLLLHPDDPLAVEPFCLVLTANFSVVLTLGLDDNQTPQFLFSFDPDTIWQGWRSLRSRLQLTTPSILPQLQCIADQFAPAAPDYRTVMEFSQLLMMHTPHERPGRGKRSFRTISPKHRQASAASASSSPSMSSRSSATASVTAPATANRSQDIAAPMDTSSAPRYPSKPLNVNRTDRVKLGVLTWDDMVSPSKENKGASNSSKRQATEPVSAKKDGADKTQDTQAIPKNEVRQAHIGSDVELLKAIAHEVRTPLTTIRTLTRLLLKRKDLVETVIKRLEQIDRECTKQIDRFSLIFKAVELETASAKHAPNHLAQISLDTMFQQNVARWQQQAKQRNLTLDVALPPSLPPVMSDPTMLDQVLTGLLDRMTHTLPPGTLIQLSVVPAGHQLKLQFWAKSQTGKTASEATIPPVQSSISPQRDQVNNREKDQRGTPESCLHSIFAPTLKSVGQLLMFQPETGNLSLNLDVTKNIFQSLGGKLIVRHTPTKGEVLTIFLPMDNRESTGLSPALKGKYFC